MPNWRIHLAACDKLAESYDMNNKLDAFKFGSILPDMPWSMSDTGIFDSGYNTEEHRKLHYNLETPADVVAISDYHAYWNPRKLKIVESIVRQGYLFHLILDCCFNEKYNQIVERDASGNYVVKTYSGVDIVKESRDDFMQLKWRDAYAYASELPYCPIEFAYILNSDIFSAQEVVSKAKLNAEEIVKHINAVAYNVTYQRYIVFAKGQYDGIVNNAIKLFKSLIESEKVKV